LCGDYRFEIAGPIILLKNCHCGRCRKMSGGTFATFARAYTQDLRVLAGSDALTTFVRSERWTIAFCNRCGSVVPNPPPGSPLVEFGAGLLDDDPGVRISYHIFVASRAPWCELEDELPKFDELD
jgi:hypothetical protein